MKKLNSVAIRKIKILDARNLLRYLNKLVEFDRERAERVEDVKKIKIDDEIDWIKVRLESERKKEMFVLCCEINGEIVSVGEVERSKRWIDRHVAEIRFGALLGYEDVVIQMLNQLVKKAKKNGVKVLVYFHLVSQKIGLSIMKRLGFYKVGIIKNYYKRRGEYVDRIYMAMSL